MGTPISEAANSNFALPTIALAIPPPTSPTGLGSCVKNAQLIDVTPLYTRYPRIRNRIATETNAQTPVIVNMRLLRNFLQRSRKLIGCPFRFPFAWSPRSAAERARSGQTSE